MTTIPADDLATIEHLDFAPPCERSNRSDRSRPCPDPAVYIVTFRMHCRGVVTGIWCQPCLDWLLDDCSHLACSDCGTDWFPRAVSDYILSFEPIGGKS